MVSPIGALVHSRLAHLARRIEERREEAKWAREYMERLDVEELKKELEREMVRFGVRGEIVVYDRLLKVWFTDHTEEFQLLLGVKFGDEEIALAVERERWRAAHYSYRILHLSLGEFEGKWDSWELWNDKVTPTVFPIVATVASAIIQAGKQIGGRRGEVDLIVFGWGKDWGLELRWGGTREGGIRRGGTVYPPLTPEELQHFITS